MKDSASDTNDQAMDSEGKPVKSKIKFENKLPREEAVAYFEAIVESLKIGTLSFTQGDDSVELAPGEMVSFEVKASKKGSKEKVAFELEWDTKEKKLEISTARAS